MFYKKRYLLILIMFLFAASRSIFPQDYQLVWSDEFNGTEINRNNWTNEVGEYWANNEIQAYTNSRSNSYVENGMLKIVARNEKYGVRDYTSARMITKEKQPFLYGKIEARIKLPFGQGIWPAFWTLGENISSVGWPKCGEIDILEMIGGSGRENTMHANVHWDADGHASYGGHTTLNSGNYSDDFHLYTINWDPEKIEWFIDNVKYHTVDITPSHMSEFHKDHFILLNIAVGGDWPGYPDASTQFPQTMEVDYVRVYQQTDLFPQTNITEPVNNSTFAVHEPIKITANVDYENEINKVEFYQGSVQIGETSVEPYTMIWNNVEAGSYKISARVVANNKLHSDSENINIVVGDGAIASPYKGYLHQVPGIIEAENYDIGEEGVTHSDNDAVNTGGGHRSNSVDIEECSDEGEGCNVGWTKAGEWLTYSIYVAESGSYVFTSRVASETSAGRFKIEIDGNDKTGSLVVPNTGGWQTWVDVASQEVELTEGNHILKISITAGDFNLNKINIFPKDAVDKVTLISPNGGEIWKAGDIKEIRWNSQLMDKVKLVYSVNGGNGWATIDQDIKAEFGLYRWVVPNNISDECKVGIQNVNASSTYDISENNFTITDVTINVENENVIFEYSLDQNYPNPFNPTTMVNYTIKNNSRVVLAIYNTLGQKVAELFSGTQSVGKHSIFWNAAGYSSGTYFVKFNAESLGNNETYSEVKKILLLK